jgi:hypothetical protein
LAVLGPEPESFILEAVDPEPEVVAHEPEIAVLGLEAAKVVVYYNYKDSGT